MAGIAKAVVELVGNGVTALAKAPSRCRVGDFDAIGVGILCPRPYFFGIVCRVLGYRGGLRCGTSRNTHRPRRVDRAHIAGGVDVLYPQTLEARGTGIVPRKRITGVQMSKPRRFRHQNSVRIWIRIKAVQFVVRRVAIRGGPQKHQKGPHKTQIHFPIGHHTARKDVVILSRRNRPREP